MSKSLMIIGAGLGIGQAVAERFGQEGWTSSLTVAAAKGSTRSPQSSPSRRPDYETDSDSVRWAAVIREQ